MLEAFKGSSYFFNSAGGFAYHLRAWRYRSTHWKNYIHELHDWLSTLPKTKSLLLIGPSSGYCLTNNFLNEYEEVHVIEPDPLARILFSQRFSHAKIEKQAAPLIEPGYLQDFASFLQENHSESLILFTNIWGQIPVLYPKETLTRSQLKPNDEYLEELESFFQKIKKLKWASFHDRISTNSKPYKFQSFETEKALPINELAKKIYGDEGARYLSLRDHFTESIGPDKKRRVLLWPRTPKALHFIECVRNA